MRLMLALIAGAVMAAGATAPRARPSDPRGDRQRPAYAPGEVPAELAPAVGRAEQALQTLQTALAGRLREELSRHGPAAAMKVCREEARAITARVAKEQGIDIGRTSHRLRNPGNAARPWAEPFVLGIGLDCILIPSSLSSWSDVGEMWQQSVCCECRL